MKAPGFKNHRPHYWQPQLPHLLLEVNIATMSEDSILILGDVLTFVGYTAVNELAHCSSYITENYTFVHAVGSRVLAEGSRHWQVPFLSSVLIPIPQL